MFAPTSPQRQSWKIYLQRTKQGAEDRMLATCNPVLTGKLIIILNKWYSFWILYLGVLVINTRVYSIQMHHSPALGKCSLFTVEAPHYEIELNHIAAILYIISDGNGTVSASTQEGRPPHHRSEYRILLLHRVLLWRVFLKENATAYTIMYGGITPGSTLTWAQ